MAIRRFPICSCGHQPKSTDEMNDRYDSYVCSKCDVWLDPKCPDSSACPVCTGRPEKPSEVVK